MTIEIAANGLESALNAQAGGAARIELCTDLEIGGTTPSAGSIRLVKERLDIPVFVLLRPRGGDFIYSDTEFETILADIRYCKEIGIDGIVVGMLTMQAGIDREKLVRAKEAAGNIPVTFNRAFDLTAHAEDSLNILMDCGVERLLTSGQKSTAIEGRFLIRQLVNQGQGRIIIMPGSGINENNIIPISEFTGAREFHSSGKLAIKSQMPFIHREMVLKHMDDLSPHDYYLSDEKKIRKMVSSLEQLADK